VVDTTTVEPRFSTSYDINGDGKMLASLNLAATTPSSTSSSPTAG
jgi:hypothetical protein